ncbi:MAG: transposase domain-containing protein [Opitutaceae bacterium]|nr:transposase domain-containing protein [Opitutaceae bacterium]
MEFQRAGARSVEPSSHSQFNSIIVSRQRFCIDPFTCLKDLLTRLPRMTNQDDLAALTRLAGKRLSDAALPAEGRRLSISFRSVKVNPSERSSDAYDFSQSV